MLHVTVDFAEIHCQWTFYWWFSESTFFALLLSNISSSTPIFFQTLMLYNRLWVLFVPIKVIDRAEKTRKLKKGFVINDFTYNKVSPVHTFSPPLLLPETDLPVVAIYQKCRCPYLRGCSLSDFSSCQQVGDVQKWPRINVILPSVVSSISFF